MNRLQVDRLPLLTLLLMVVSVTGLMLMASTRRALAASTIHVTTTADSGPGSLRQAINDAAAGDTIDFNLSYAATITLTSGELLINKNLTINGPGASNLTVSGNNASRVFHLTPPATVTISWLTITKGNSNGGGGILSEEAPFTLNDCVISNNKAVSGGGILNLYESSWTMTNCTVSNNTATVEGGGIHNRLGTLTMTDCTVSDNVAVNPTSNTGGILNVGTLTMTNCTVSNNTTNGVNNGAGGISNGSGQLMLTNCTVVNNAARPGINAKGGIKVAGQVILNNTIVAGNTTDFGRIPSDIEGGTIAAASHCLIGDAGTSVGITDGANGNLVGINGAGTRPIDAIVNPVLEDNGGPTKTHMIVCGSVAYNTGDNTIVAALPKDQRGSRRVIDGTVDVGALEAQPVNNTNDSGPGSLRQMITDAQSGDCIDIDSCLTGTITLASPLPLITRNLAINGPGADKLTVSGNNASTVFIFFHLSNAALNRLTIANGNSANAGGGINCDKSNVTINNCDISHNKAVNGGTGDGGAILNFSPVSSDRGLLIINSCTISDNEADNGGGIFNGINATLVINNSTIANNSATNRGGGIYNSATSTVTSSTITGNSSEGLRCIGFQTTTLNNVLIAGNGSDISLGNAPIIAASHCLIGAAGSAGGIINGINGNIVGVNGAGTRDINSILNTTLADNGGPTKTHALVCGSAAIDAGDNAFVTATDQRGLARIYDGNGDATATTDIGAVEKENACPSISAQAVSLAKNSSLTGVQIATVKDAEDAEQSLLVTADSPQNNVTISNITVASNGQVTANVNAPCNAASANFTLTVKDSSMQSTSTTLTVTATPSNPPSFVGCPGNITRSNDPGQCTASASFAPTAGDDCSGSLVPVCKVGATVITSPHAFPKGATTVTCTATDADNQTAACSFTVTVTDTQAPAINYAGVAAQSANTDSNCSAAVPDVISLVRAQSSDSCTANEALVITQSPAAGSPVSGVGSYPITVTVKDADNNGTTWVLGFTLNDTTPPTITCPANITAPAAAGQCGATVTYAAPAVSDNCPGVGVPLCAPPSGSAFPKGTTTLSCTVKDAVNNQSACGFTVTVVDSQAPTIVCPANIIINTVNAGDAGVAVSFAAPVAVDNCSGVTVACVPPSGSMFPRGVTRVSCKATDAAGNQTSCGFTVKVFDYVMVDESNGRILRFVSTTGEYDYFDWRKNQSLSRVGVVTISSCKATLLDVGPDANHPDRNVMATANPCTKAGSTSISYGGVTATLNDANMSNNPVRCP